MSYDCSRGGAMAASGRFRHFYRGTGMPTNTIWSAAVGAFLLGLPYLYSPTAYFAVTSIAVIGLYIAYAMPVFLRLRAGESFRRGPWHLGRWSYVVGWIAVGWVIFIAVLFSLPQYSPITIDTFNYAPVAVVAVLLFAGVWWMVSARKWFKGPKVQGSPEELAAIERDLERV